MNNLCEVTTPAVVKWDLSSIAESVKDDCSSALSIAPCIANIPSLKTARAQLNADHKRIDLDLTAMKTLYMKPWEDFKAEFEDKITAEYRNADEVLKAEITACEDELRNERKEELLDYIESVTGTRDETLLPDKILLSASAKSLKNQIIGKIANRNAKPIIAEKCFIVRGIPEAIEAAKMAIRNTGCELEEVE